MIGMVFDIFLLSRVCLVLGKDEMIYGDKEMIHGDEEKRINWWMMVSL